MVEWLVVFLLLVTLGSMLRRSAHCQPVRYPIGPVSGLRADSSKLVRAVRARGAVPHGETRLGPSSARFGNKRTSWGERQSTVGSGCRRILGRRPASGGHRDLLSCINRSGMYLLVTVLKGVLHNFLSCSLGLQSLSTKCRCWLSPWP